MTIDLSIDEVVEVIALLETHASDLYSEVRRTHNPEAHDDLIDQRHRIHEILRKMRVPAPSGTSNS